MTIDLSKHREAFLSEASTHVATINRSLIELEKDPTEAKLLQDIFRSVHTLKSLSATMSYENSMALCHAIEDVLAAIKNETLTLDEASDLLFNAFDHLSATLKNISEHGVELSSKQLTQQFKQLLAHELIPRLANRKEISSAIEKISAIEVKVEQLDSLMNIAEELIVSKMKFENIREKIDQPELAPAVESLGRLITDLQFRVMQVRLVPIQFVFNRFFRMARDIAKQQKKEINLHTEGGDIELDRMLIENITEAIAHLLRNAIDHGIEPADVRKKLNKPAAGNIYLRASRSKETALIEVADDGAGLDLRAIKAKAIARQLLDVDASDEEIQASIFSGISTNEEVTAISGRGLGLGIVKQKIEAINGTIKVDSIPNQETTFIIEIPLTLAIIKTLFVRVGTELYAIPVEAVERLITVPSTSLKGLLNFEAIIYEDEDIPVIRLNELFELETKAHDKQSIVIVKRGSERLGLMVDQLLSTQEIIIKPLSRALRENKYFSGAALLGSGQMILIIDVAFLLAKSTRNKKE